MSDTAEYRNANEIIKSLYLDTLDEDSYIHEVKRYIIQKYVRSGVQEFIAKYTANTKSVMIPIVDHRVKLPKDFLRLWRLSIVNECGTLSLLAASNKIPIANQFLLDDQGVQLLGSGGEELMGDGDLDYSGEGCNIKFDDLSHRLLTGSSCIATGYFNPSNQYYSINPTFVRGLSYRVDPEKGVIQMYGDDSVTDSVVVDYSYDVLKNISDMDLLSINSLFADALEKWVYLKMISRKRSVPLNEKTRAERDLKKSLLEARLAKNTPSVQDIISITNLK
jgi:hypothetical protein